MATGFEYLLTKQNIQSTVEQVLVPQVELFLNRAWDRLNPLLPSGDSNQTNYSKDDILLLLLLFTAWLDGEWLDEFSAAFVSQVEAANEIERAFWEKNGYPIPDGVQDSVAEAFSSQRDWKRIADVTINRTVTGILRWDAAEGLVRRDLNELLSYWYSRSRAQNIASSETTALNSILTKEYMDRLGLRRWVWWTTPPEWSICSFCRGNHGVTFDIADPMPPDASHPHCKCVPEVLFD